MTPDMLTLKVHVDDEDEVWYLNTNGPPVQLHMSVAEFLLHPLSHDMPRIRIAGFPQNFQLALALYIRRLKDENGTVELCSPMVCKTNVDRHDPSKVLYAMRQYERPTSMGGWHAMKYDDYMNLALASHLLKRGGEVDDISRRLFKNHPVRIPVTFITHLNIDACIKLLALIGDPRWFIDPIHPTRGSRLRRFLGLNLGNKNEIRSALVHDAWCGEHNPKWTEKPDYFLFRVQRESMEKHNNAPLADLRAAQTFIEYLRLCWLAALGRGKHQREALFVPEYFFKEKYETKAFYDHFTRTLANEQAGQNPPKR